MTDNAKIMTASCAAGAAFAVIPTAYGIMKNLAPKPLTKDDILSVRDGGFETASGCRVSLRGINLNDEIYACKRDGEDISEGLLDIFSGFEGRFGRYGARKLMNEYSANFVSDNDLKYISKLGADCVRVPLRYYEIFRKDSCKGDGDFERLDKIVEKCRKLGLYVIFDLHSAPGFQNNDVSCGKADSCTLFGSGKESFEARNAVIRLWSQMAAHYKDEPAVAAFDLLNRPLNRVPDTEGAVETLHKFYHRIFKAIRNIDENRIIIMESAGYDESLPDAKKYKDKNVAFGLYSHFHTTFETDSMVKSVVKNRSGGVPYIVCKIRTDENWNYSLGALCDRNISWIMGDFKGAQGRYCLFEGTPEAADLSSESYDELTAKWQKPLSTKNFTENKELAKTLKTYFAYGTPIIGKEPAKKPEIKVKFGTKIIKGVKK